MRTILTPTRYSSPDVNMLVLRRAAFSTAMLGPTGELIERTPDTLLILWRVPPFAAGFGPYYQRVTYQKIDQGDVPVHGDTRFDVQLLRR